ncbi:putative trigger factor [Lupinus albus]|uniref:peptidylprolyl isomerase n=1 Tax=Lupinus albus TaxID=3870 RepID=A0A6A4P1F5_LUPAL|nr:putative trigger factor [Lupinus albus]
MILIHFEMSISFYREHINCHPTAAVSDAQTSSANFEEFSVSVADINDVRELKISIEVSGNKTQKIFDDVFEKMVAAAQPIPGFRRVKGGKTPDIPKDILLEVLGPFNVYRKVIKQIINSTIGEYVEKVRLVVSNDLRVEQSFEDLEASFEAGEKFSFDAVIQLEK